MRNDCLMPADLVALALGEAPVDARVTRHAETCEECRTNLIRVREAATAMRVGAAVSSRPATACLGDEAIAALVGPGGWTADPATATHLADCARCCRRIAIVTRQLQDETVTAELRRVEESGGGPVRGRRALATGVGAAATLAAAAVALLLLPPGPASRTGLSAEPGAGVHRERAVTTTLAPRVVGPEGVATASDSMRWTAVPHADRYEVSVFDRDGTVVWDTLTTDTVLAIPPHLVRPEPVTYLWKVRARTSWDRWVISEWADLTLRAGR